jgi:hypothetical protein
VLCRTYGSLEKSYEAAASYGTKVESGRELKIENGKLKVDKTTVAKACSNETTNASKAAGQGIVKKPVKAERERKLKLKKKKRNKKTKRNKTVNKNGNMREKRIRGKP